MDIFVPRDIELERREALVRESDGCRIAGTRINFRGPRREQRIRVCFSEAAIRTRDQGNRVLDVHDSFCPFA